MSINHLLEEKLFLMYGQITNEINVIQKSHKSLEDKRHLMKQLRQEHEKSLRHYNKLAVDFSKSFLEKYQLSDYVIEARVGSPTPYGNQPKGYLWSGISIEKDKSYSFQYSWVFQKELLEVTFCFGSGGSSSGNIDQEKKLEKENRMRVLERKFFEILSDENFRNIVELLIEREGFVLTTEWLNKTPHGSTNIDDFLKKLQEKTGAKSGITRFFSKEELLGKGFNLEERIYKYFELFRPIWTRLHNENLNEIKEIGIEETILDDSDVKIIINDIKSYIQQQGFAYPKNLIANFYLSLKSKPFVILAGISGTGKTKLVKLFAEAIGATEANKQFTLIPVRPDWSDPTDLIGYQDLSGVFRPGELTKVLVEASKRENRHKPYFICLDEMNLARVEHYFSDVLSLLETQQWKDGRIVTDTIVPKEMLHTSGNEERTADLFIPDNVFIVGTVNMDETTHPFSKKVLDRANTIEFNYINLQDFPEIETDEGTIEHGTASSPFLRSDYLQLMDAYAEHSELIKKTTEKLVRINQMLEEIHAHVGFRVRDAICFYMIYNQRFELMTEEQAFDLQLLQKVLPRIQGSSQSVKRLIIELMLFCTNQKGKMEELLNDASQLYDPWRRSGEETKALYPQSARKLAYMLRRLEEDGFTSFWLS
ncbi:hypothetical protein PAE9249_05348 [Paenibacillus sp. CECT 9249]|uniref:McrB family protein n=1 Tax=Paenibacillus sp. CECT 9249 TaxID=2845385 RepID=UPI001E4A1C25|nr:AAA family ATPase [Paenibacillus sp. CECT 9249]CAH0122757.1 hypothetical protein PAE9249_05348 [Paenibacillus sp. CECT 9249]